MAVNKVEYGNDTLIDLTEDTVDEESVLEGRRFHAPDGSIKEGKVVVAEVIDNLESENSTDALSARQGKVLNEKIDERSQGFSYDETEAKLTFSGTIGGSGYHVYSDEEHVVGVWKVGVVEKPVYERTINIGKPYLSGTLYVIDYDITFLNIDMPISFTARTKTKIYAFTVAHAPEYSYSIGVGLDRGLSKYIIQVRNGINTAHDEDILVTLNYTKTTD